MRLALWADIQMKIECQNAKSIRGVIKELEKTFVEYSGALIVLAVSSSTFQKVC